jgi:hypothetical protein
MNRKLYNTAIVEKLKELVNKYPDLRFGQLLVNTSIIEIIPSDEQVLAKDPFYEESEVTWERMKGNRFAFKELFN